MTSLYRAFDDTGRLLYVGIADRWTSRWSAHDRTSPWFGLVRRIELEDHPDRDTAHAAERAAIRTEHPIYNSVRYAGTATDERSARSGIAGITPYDDPRFVEVWANGWSASQPGPDGRQPFRFPDDPRTAQLKDLCVRHVFAQPGSPDDLTSSIAGEAFTITCLARHVDLVVAAVNGIATDDWEPCHQAIAELERTASQ